MSSTLRLFCFLLLIAGSWSESTVNEQDIQKLNSTALAVISSIDTSLTQIENSIEKFKTSSWNTVDYYRKEAQNLVDRVQSFVDYATNKLEVELSNLIRRNISETTCDLVGRFREQAIQAFDSVRSCVNGTIDRGIARVRDISNAGSTVRMTLQNKRKQMILCMENITNFNSSVSCVSQVASSVKKIITTIPRVIADFIDLGIIVGTFPQKMELCAAQGPFEVITKHYISVLTKFPECLSKKIATGISNFWDKVGNVLENIQNSLSEKKLPNHDDILNKISSKMDYVDPNFEKLFFDEIPENLNAR